MFGAVLGITAESAPRNLYVKSGRRGPTVQEGSQTALGEMGSGSLDPGLQNLGRGAISGKVSLALFETLLQASSLENLSSKNVLEKNF